MTARSTLFRVLDGVAVISLNAPPVNALSAPLRAALAEYIRRVDTEAHISAAVLRAEGALFSAGADIRELDADWQAPAPRDLCDLVEGCSKPVIAALNGRALGGGAELLLAAHYRLAEPRARIGFPEVTLGVLPGAGGTQRLPRLVGPEAALKLMVSGQSVSAPEARQLGLVDGIVEGDLASGAVTFARKLVADGTGPRPTRVRRGGLADGRACQAQVASARREIADSPLFAPHLIVDCVEAASLLPFEAGQAFEQDAFDRCRIHPQSIALRHVFLAERRVDARLLHRSGGTFVPAEPAGAAVVTRLRGALRDAAQAVVKTLEVPEARVDRAMVAHGFRTGVFGHSDPGPDSAPVMRRLTAALISEGAALVAEGHLDRPSDIDAMAVHGLGYPRRQGGPCRAAQTRGLLALRNDMRTWSRDNPIWAPPAMLEEAVKLAAGFDAL